MLQEYRSKRFQIMLTNSQITSIEALPNITLVLIISPEIESIIYIEIITIQVVRVKKKSLYEANSCYIYKYGFKPFCNCIR